MRTFAAFRGMRGFQKPLILVLINTFMIDKKTIQTAVEEWLQKGDYFLVDVEMNPDGRIVIEIDCADGVWIEDCADLSRHLQEQLGDELGDYELEVGSAGIGQPFKVVQQYLNRFQLQLKGSADPQAPTKTDGKQKRYYRFDNFVRAMIFQELKND